ncbi:HNH endonuclease [Streptomyces cinerochromogenes]|uniref:HNH endonuclease n=1 Tax=Streptomyces cinerochromogenes TaxID=66422 RepID=A0ABW7BC11_9ACTN
MDEWSCAYCDCSFGPMVVAEVDHIRPLAAGGVHEWFNLTVACAHCNGSKGPKPLAEWLTENAGEGFTVDDEAVTQRSMTPRRGSLHESIT